MPNNREMKAFLQPLLNRRRDLQYNRQLLFLVPFTHYFRGVFFDQSRWGNSFTVVPIASPLFDGLDVRSHLLLPMSLYRRTFTGPWNHSDDIARQLCDFVENEVLPMVQPADNLRELTKRPEWMCSLGAAGVACLLGNHEQAYELAKNIHQINRGSVTEHRHNDYDWREMYLCHLIETNRSKIPEQLFEWERQAVTESKLTKYWKPMPFGVET